jgi:hypothetical protein
MDVLLQYCTFSLLLYPHDTFSGLSDCSRSFAANLKDLSLSKLALQNCTKIMHKKTLYAKHWKKT